MAWFGFPIIPNFWGAPAVTDTDTDSESPAPAYVPKQPTIAEPKPHEAVYCCHCGGEIYLEKWTNGQYDWEHMEPKDKDDWRWCGLWTDVPIEMAEPEPGAHHVRDADPTPVVEEDEPVAEAA